MNKKVPKLVVIVGATATGKSGLAIALAERFDGEILCADSRTVYRGMDIGTAKPTTRDQARVPHWGLDLVDPGEPFTAADYQEYANRMIMDISGRGKLPIMVGGSGMYIDSVLYGYSFRPAHDPALRSELERLSIAELQARIRYQGIAMPENERNPRYLIRANETGRSGGQADRERGMRANTVVVGLDMDIDRLEQRIAGRVDGMVAHGLIDEVQQLGARFGWEVQAMQSPGYREFRAYFGEQTDLAETNRQIIKNTRALAKRQKTWFRRNKSIHWLTTEDKLAESVEIITTELDT